MFFLIIIPFVTVVITIIIVSQYLKEFSLASFSIGSILGLLIGFVVGLIGGAICTANFAFNNDNYEITSKSSYSLVHQNFDNKDYYVKENTSIDIYYDFEYAIAETSKNIHTNKNVLIKYGIAERPKVVVEHYEPSGFLQLFTFADSKDYYYITLCDTHDLYMTLE